MDQVLVTLTPANALAVGIQPTVGSVVAPMTFSTWDAPAVTSLTDDLLAIYADLKHGLNGFEQGQFSRAAWHWRSTLFSHWGGNAVNALRAIHRALHKVNE